MLPTTDKWKFRNKHKKSAIQLFLTDFFNESHPDLTISTYHPLPPKKKNGNYKLTTTTTVISATMSPNNSGQSDA